MTQHAYVAAARRAEHVRRISAKELRGAFEEDSFRRRQQSRQREADIVEAVFAASEVLAHQWTIGPWQDVVVLRVYFSESRAHLAHSQTQSGGQGGEGEEGFFDIHARFAERDKGVGAGIRID